MIWNQWELLYILFSVIQTLNEVWASIHQEDADLRV